MGSSTICQEILKESYPSVHLVIGRQTSGYLQNQQSQQICPHPSMSWLGKSLRSADLGRYPCRRENLQNSSLPEGNGGKKIEFGGSGDSNKRNFPNTSFPKETLHGADLSSDGVLHHGGKNSNKWEPGHSSCAGQLKNPVSLQRCPKHGG